MVRIWCVALLAIVAATPVRAGGADDLAAGLAAGRNGRHDEAIRLLTRALQTGDLSPDDRVTADKTRGSEYFTKSLIADAFDRRDEARGLRDSAVADYTDALRIKPDDVELLSSRGQSLEVNGQYQQAIADFDASQRLKPSPITLMQRAGSYRAGGDYDHAIADYTAAFGLDAKDTGLEPWDIHQERGYAAFFAGRFDAAAIDFQAALTLGSAAHADDVLWLPYQAAWLHIARGRAGQDDKDALAANAARMNLKQWPGTLIAFFLGQARLEDVAAPTSHGSMGRSRECNMSFFVGQAALIKGDAATAERSLKQALAVCNARMTVSAAADAELKRLKR